MRYDTRDWVVAKQLLDEITMIKSAFLVSFYPPSGILRSTPHLAKNIQCPRRPDSTTYQYVAPKANMAHHAAGDRARTYAPELIDW